MPDIQIKDTELIQLFRLDKKRGCELLYDQYSAHLYGFILRTVTDPATASEILLATFTEAYRQIDTTEPGQGGIFMLVLNITRSILHTHKEHTQAIDHAHELILYKGMNCEQAALLTYKPESEIKTDLRLAVQKNRQPSL